MKRTLSLILAALLLASSAACGKASPSGETTIPETQTPETQTAETSISETIVPETDSPAPSYAYDTSLITENSIAKAHIVLSDNASAEEKKAADELVYHIKLVSGAEISVTNAVQADSLPIIIATPDTLPELESIFPEDLAWLRVLSGKSENGNNQSWTKHGFSIRLHEGKIYIFGSTSVGAMNGVYDFIEENLDVIWVGKTEAGIIYDEMATITAAKVNYREKSPFSLYGSDAVYYARNKLSSRPSGYGNDANVKNYILNSPIYDPNITEYWDTDTQGNPLAPSHTYGVNEVIPNDESLQVNFWSQLTADTIAATVIKMLDDMDEGSRPLYFNVCMEDQHRVSVYPDMTLPFEYAPGEFVDPSDSAYLSTVYFTFINRIAEKVYEKYPDVYINTLAYMWAIEPPKCEIRDNVSIWFAPYNDDYTVDGLRESLTMEFDDKVPNTKEYAEHLEGWKEKTSNLLIYNYYFTVHVQGWYERPIWYRLGNDFKYFADIGVMGNYACWSGSEGNSTPYFYRHPHYYDPDDPLYNFTFHDAFEMNRMSYWIYTKLCWDPYEDVDALIVKYCDKVYGDASEYMQEYYRLLKQGWDIGSVDLRDEFNMQLEGDKDQQYFFDYFLDVTTEDGVYIFDAVREALANAYEIADDKAKEFIRYPYERFNDWQEMFGLN